MRNYLPIPASERLHRRIGRRVHHRLHRLRPMASPVIALLILAAALRMSGLVRADNGQVCNGAPNTQVVFTDPDAGGATYPGGTVRTDQWISDSSTGDPFNTNMVYRVYEFYSHAEPPGNPAASGDFCSTQFTVDTNNAFYKYNGQRAVNIRLGVPNFNLANNFGRWRFNANSGSGINFRPPKTMRNFDSQAVYNDDGGMFTMHSARFNNTNGHQQFYKVWCKNWNASVGMLGGDDAGGCVPDISTFADGSNNGAGYMMVQDNCHYDDPANGFGATYNQDSDGVSMGACNANLANSDAQNNYYGQHFTAAALGGVQFHPNNGWHNAICGCTDPMFNLSFKDFLGCGGGPCDGYSQPIDAFNVNQYARNHTTANAGDAHFLSAQTDLTFAYPLPAVMNMTMTTNGCRTLQGKIIEQGGPNTTCFAPPSPAKTPPGGPFATNPAATGSSFQIMVTNIPASGFTHAGDLATGKVVVQLPNPANSAVSYDTSLPTSCGGTPPVYNAPGSPVNSLTFTLTTGAGSDIDNLNGPGGGSAKPIYLCFNLKTSAAYLGSYNITATSSGTLRRTGIAAQGTSLINQNFVTNVASSLQNQPDTLIQSGDINAGGFIGNCDSTINPGNPANFIQGTFAQGSYNYHDSNSAGGTVNFFPSASNLEMPFYYTICRPDLAAAADAAIAIGSTSALRIINDSNATDAQINTDLSTNWGPIPTLVYDNCTLAFPGCIVHMGPLSIKSRVTFYLKGAGSYANVIRNILPNVSGAAVSTANLPSFGLIAPNIFVGEKTFKMWGAFYAQNEIVECTNDVGTPYDYRGLSIPAPNPPSLLPQMLHDHCNSPGGDETTFPFLGQDRRLNVYGSMFAHSYVLNRINTFNDPSSSGHCDPIPAPCIFNGKSTTEDFTQMGFQFLAPPPIFDTHTQVAPSTSVQVLPPQY